MKIQIALFMTGSFACSQAFVCGDALADNSQNRPFLALGESVRPSTSPDTKMTTSGPVPQTQPATPIVSPSDANTPAATSPANTLPATPAANQNAPNAATIEIDSGLAPLSPPPGTKGLTVVGSLNESLLHGPQAAAIRAQFAVARSNYATASQGQNQYFFMDRGLVAEQVNRIGPVFVLDLPWKLCFRMLIAKRLVAQTKIDLLTQLWTLRANVRRAYVELVVAQETQENLVELYKLASRLSDISEKRFHAGDVPELDVLKAKLAAAQTETDVAVGSKRIIRAKQQLNILMGHAVDAPIFVQNLPDYGRKTPAELKGQKSEMLPDFDRTVAPLSAFVEKALATRLELKSLAMQLKVNSANKLGAFGSVIPNPSFATGKSTNGNPLPGPKLTAVFMTLNQEMPMVNFNQGAIYQYKSTETQLKYQITAQQNQVISDVSAAYNNLLGYREKIRNNQEMLLSQSNEVARLARRSYEMGQTDITSTLQAQQANIATRSAYLDAITNYAGAFTDLEFAVGKPLQ
jgi:cobalt-zinc-cadmium efflux system outer membrane protein